MYHTDNTDQKITSTVEPPSKGHFGTNHSVRYREDVLFSEVYYYNRNTVDPH